jgi:hypothetical protein
MVTKRVKHRRPARWVYAYELNPPQPEPRFKRISMLLRRAQVAARRGGQLWTGRIVLETNITHILVVTDNPGQVNDVDQAIETELRHLNMGFALRGPARFALSLGKPRTRAPRKPAPAKPRSKRRPRRT